MSTYIIAEIGINHNGDLALAKKLIDVADFSGCDAVKFQKRDPDMCIPEHQKSLERDTPWGKMTYLEYKKKIEFGKKEYDEIDSYCKKRSLDWSASPWDLNSLMFLCQYDLPWIKIPSAMLTNDELLWACVATGKKIMLSTGMSTQEEVDHAVGILRAGDGEFALLHCNSTYPAPLEELNLRAIEELKKRYGCEVGYSGHEFRIGTTVASIYLGASIIERHITLDRSSWGTDQLSSVEPQGLVKLVRGIRELEMSYGEGAICITESEKEVRRKLRGN